MKDLRNAEDRRVYLGRASAETKGAAIFDVDPSGGQLRYMPGVVHD